MSKSLNLTLSARAKLAWQVLTNSYVGASRSRNSLSQWTPRGGDANDSILFDLPTLRERSRDMLRNNPLALGAINTKVTNTVGTGLTLNASIDRAALGLAPEQADEWETEIERQFNAWAESADCDIERALNFAEMQALAFRSVLENGDVFALLPMAELPDDPFRQRVQLIEADRISNPNWKSDTETLAGGIQHDAAGAPSGYWIARTHPGSMRGNALQWDFYRAFGERTGRRNVLHLYSKLRIGQSRGVPDLAPVVETLKSLGDYSKAELDAAVATAFLAIITKTPQRQGLGPAALGGAADTSSKSDPYKIGGALVLDLKDGEDIETVNPNRPNEAFDPFTLALLRQIGVALELPFEVLVKHFTASYSAARAALEDAKRFFKGRRIWLAANFCQPIYEAFVWDRVASGAISAPGFLFDARIRRAYLGSYRDQWIGPGFAAINPKDEYEAAVIAEDRGWKTATENTAEISGGDWWQKLELRQRERAAMPAPQAPANPAQPKPQQNPDQQDTGT